MASDCDVLIVGGGPTGITLALIAAQHGARVVVCEKEANLYPLPRAAHIDHEVMRIFQSIGVAEAIARTSRTTSHYDFLTAEGEILLRFDGSDTIGAGGWPSANMIHQPSLERALRDKLASEPNAQLFTRWSYTGHDEHSDGLTARFATPDGPRRVAAKFIVGADGARSPVRETAGITFDDLDFDEPWLVVDAIVHDFDRLPKVNLQICDPARPTTCVLMGEGRHRWEFMLLPGETAEEVSSDDFVWQLLEPWQVEGAVTLERKAVYRFNARIARHWRKGRVLLAGDAAHQTPPFAGQGLCAGSRDAANLGWKLGLLAQGRAGEGLLDSYQCEREPHVRATIGMAMMMGKTVCITDRVAAAERDEQMLAARAAGQSPDGNVEYPPIMEGMICAGTAGAGTYFPQAIAEDGSRLDALLGNREWLISLGDLAHEPLANFAEPIGRWLNSHGAEAVLVRPDRYVFGTGSPDMLRSAWEAQLAESHHD